MNLEIAFERLAAARCRNAAQLGEPIARHRQLISHGIGDGGEVRLVGADQMRIGFGTKAVREGEDTATRGHDGRFCPREGALRQDPRCAISWNCGDWY